jgi:chromatin assembly factor 1 subunit A
VELKNGKVIFKQKLFSLEKFSETMQGLLLCDVRLTREPHLLCLFLFALDIVRFREMLEQRLKQQESPLDVFPDEHRPLIAKLCHERFGNNHLTNKWLHEPIVSSEKSLTVLAKHVHHELLPAQDECDEDDTVSPSLVLPVHLVEAAIKLTLTRVNYGLDNYGLDIPLGLKVPASLCIWRWEVKDEYRHWLPKAAKDKIEARLADRLQVCT